MLGVCAVIRRGDEVALVGQRSPDGAGLMWTLPTGRVEQGELADQAVVREVWEETGLKAVRSARLVGVVQVQGPEMPSPGVLTGMLFEVVAEGALSPQDPDGDVIEVAWVPVAEAVRRLGALPDAHMREPAIHCLTHPDAEAWFWSWPEGLARPPVVIAG